MQIELDKYSIRGDRFIKILREADRLKMINCEWETIQGIQDRETLICKIDTLWFVFPDDGEDSESFKIVIYNRYKDVGIIVFDWKGWLYTEKEFKYKRKILSLIEKLFKDKRLARIREPLMNTLCAHNKRKDIYLYNNYEEVKTCGKNLLLGDWDKNWKDTLKFLNSCRLEE